MSCWPYDASSQSPPKGGIDWSAAAPGFEDAPLWVWRKVSKHDAELLLQDPRFADLLGSLSAEVKEVVQAVASGRKIGRSREPKASGAKPKTEKDNLLMLVEELLADAEDQGDLTARVRGIELRAKLNSLLTQKTPEEDRTVVINVVTGVVRK